METFDIWMEGYAITGNHSNASFVGRFKGIDFLDACKNSMKEDEEADKYYNEKNNTYWGCKLFNNESDARKSFG